MLLWLNLEKHCILQFVTLFLFQFLDENSSEESSDAKAMVDKEGNGTNNLTPETTKPDEPVGIDAKLDLSTDIVIDTAVED